MWLIFKLKQNVFETEGNRYFWKNVKSCLQKKESVSRATCKAWSFSSDFNFACKDGRATAATCKYCPLVVRPSDEAFSTVTNYCNCWVSGSAFENITKTNPVSCDPVFFLLFRNVATFIESHCVFLCCFLQYDEVFSSNLLGGCYHYLVFMDPVNCYSNSKLFVKEQASLKSKVGFGYVCLL